VVLPQLRPQIRLMVLLAILFGLKVFDLPWVMTEGGPGNATQLVGTYAYTQAFSNARSGYAAALSFVMVLIALALSTITRRTRPHAR
jgi:raffinose/stachyose/melibiose transport system permease protein